jgi:hypothetical protein
MLNTDEYQRLQFLARVVPKECEHLETTDGRLFAEPFTAERARTLDDDPEFAERVEAFVSRFGRLQDTLGDKLLPLFLKAAGEHVGVAIDNLDRAERLGLLPSVDEWMTMRKLRNQMVHECIEDPHILADALYSGHCFVPTLRAVTDGLLDQIRSHGWLE